MDCWGEWDGVEVYSEQGRALLTRVHDLHLAIAETQWAIEVHKGRRRVIVIFRR